MEDKDYIEQLFSTKLKDAEVPVNPELWAKVSSGISAGAAGSSAVGGSLLGGKLMWVAASIIGIGGIGAAVYLSQPNEEPVEQKIVQVVQSNNESDISEEHIEEPINTESTQSNSQKEESFEVNEINGEETLENSDAESIADDASNGEEILPDGEIAVLPTKNPNSIINSPLKREIDTRVPVITDKTQDDPGEVAESSNDIVPEKKELELPNTFSPNQDGREDYFFIRDLDEISEFQVVVLNNKNEVVYSSNDLNFKWDGRLSSGEFAEKGIYLYFLTGINPDGSKLNKASQLSIYR